MFLGYDDIEFDHLILFIIPIINLLSTKKKQVFLKVEDEGREFAK